MTMGAGDIILYWLTATRPCAQAAAPHTTSPARFIRWTVFLIMKIVIADDLPSSAVHLLQGISGAEVIAKPGRTKPELLADLADADALLVRSATKVTKDVLDAAPKLKIIARAGAGVDNIDLESASAHGVIVTNAPGGNSISVAEHAMALMLTLARSVSVAAAAMKEQRWEKKSLTGAELRGKTLGVVGFGRIGQAVAHRARAFGMKILAHDPYLAEQVGTEFDAELVDLDRLCAESDYITLHSPVNAATTKLFNAERFAKCKRGVRIINTARGELIDDQALLAALESGHIGGAGLDVFVKEPPVDWSLISHPRVVATPHIAASTTEAQEIVGVDVAEGVRDYLLQGVVRNAVNFASVPAEEFKRLTPFMDLAKRLGRTLAQLSGGRTQSIGIRYYGSLAEGPTELLAASVLIGLFEPILSSGVSLVNARAVAAQRGVEIVETRSTRSRNFTNLISVKLHTDRGERWVEGTTFEHGGPRLVLLDGVPVEAPLDGTLVVMRNNDLPGVIGEVGTVLGRHGLNIANFALGRDANGAVGVVNVDERTVGEVNETIVGEIERVPAIRDVWVVRV
jgi:D-3-phosphoglycerate dehydrogenase